MSQSQRALVLRWATILLTFGAFANSYRHGVQWAIQHSPAGQDQFWAWAIAALPEVMVLIAVLLAMNRLSDPRVWVIGGTGVGWTLWANGAAAAPGLSGSVVALAPAWAALLALWSMDHQKDGPVHVHQSEPVQTIRPSGSGVAQLYPVEPLMDRSTEPLFAAHTEPVDRSTEPVIRPTVNRSKRHTSGSPGTAQAQGVAWATAQSDDGSPWPTVAQILAQFPEMSRSTAKRVRAAQPPGTDGTADGANGEQ
jgi:hypothetical protein